MAIGFQVSVLAPNSSNRDLLQLCLVFFLRLFVLSGVAPLQSGNLRDPLEAGRTLI